MSIDVIVKLIMSLLTSRTTGSKDSSKKVVLPSSSHEVKEPELTEVEGYYVWQKEYSYPLSDHFNTELFECKCSNESCKEQRIFIDLVNKLEEIRTEIGQPITITSAFRCSAKQEQLREDAKNGTGQLTVVAKKSTHESGDAVDIRPKDGKDIQGNFLKVCASKFDSIGLANSFLHVDQRKGTRRWKY